MHDHLVLAQRNSDLPVDSCGFYPHLKPRYPIGEEVCKEPRTHLASKQHATVTMTADLCMAHAEVVQNCPDCMDIDIQEI